MLNDSEQQVEVLHACIQTDEHLILAITILAKNDHLDALERLIHTDERRKLAIRLAVIDKLDSALAVLVKTDEDRLLVEETRALISSNSDCNYSR